MSNAAVKATLKIEMVPVEGIVPSPFNPRKTFKAVDELAENLKQHGIKVPLRLRPIAETELASAHYEIVFGERRWRAARKAGISHVPAIVEAMNDAEARMLMLVELAQTSDVHPVEEAEVYRQLHEQDRLSVDEIAASVGKSKRVVYERLQLCALAAGVKEASLKGDLSPSHAVLIARVPSQFQEQAMKEVLEGEHGEGPMSYQDARDYILEKYTLGLAQAPWDLKDEQLVPSAGSCAKCPKRTGNQPELFADVQTKDTCTDPDCHAEKKKAFVKLTLVKAQAEGKPVLATAKEAKAALKGGAYVDLNKEQYIPDHGYTSYRKLLGKKKVEATLAPAPEGVKELVRKENLEKAIGKVKAPAAHQQTDWKKEDEKRRAKRALAEKVAAAVAAEISAKLDEKKLGKAHWFIVAENLVAAIVDQRDGSDLVCGDLIGRPASEDYADQKKDKAEAAAALAKMTAEQLQVAVVKALAFSDVFAYLDQGAGAMAELAKALGVDEEGIEARVKAEIKAAGKPGHVPPEPGAEPTVEEPPKRAKPKTPKTKKAPKAKKGKKK